MKKGSTIDDVIKPILENCRRGDMQARQELIESYMQIAREIAEKYFDLGLDSEDLVQSAYEGVIVSVDKCIQEDNPSYSQYIIRCIETHVRRALVEARAFYNKKTPYRGIEATILLVQRDLMVELGRKPTIEEICERSHIMEYTVRAIIEEDSRYENVSLESMWADDASMIVEGIVDAEFDLIQECDIETVRRKIAETDFGPKEREMIDYMLDGITKIRELKELLEVSADRAYQLRENIAKKMAILKWRYFVDGEFANEYQKRESIEHEKILKHQMVRDRQQNRHR